MKLHLSLKSKNMDHILYWFFVALIIVGVATLKLLPPKMDVVAFSGIILSCLLLKPMLAMGAR